MTWQQLETDRERFVEAVRSLPDRLQRAPVGRSFAPLEALEHLALTDTMSIDLLKRAEPKKLSGRPGTGNFLFRAAIKMMHRPKTIPTVASLVPAEMPNLESSAAQWAGVRAEIWRLMGDRPQDSACLKHPIFGHLSPSAVIQLLAAHQTYHFNRLPAAP